MREEKTNHWVSYLALVLSVISLLIWVCKYEPVTWTWLDVFSSAISLSVGVFVAVQIYQSFTLRRDINKDNEVLYQKIKEDNALMEKKAEKAISSFEKRIDEIMKEKIEDYDHTVSASVYQLYSFMLMQEQKDNEALNYLIRALELLEKGTDKSPQEGIISFIQHMEATKKNAKLSKDEVDKYCIILGKTGNKEAISLIPYIQSLGPREEHR